MAPQQLSFRSFMPRTKPWLAGAIVGAVASLIFAGLARIALFPLGNLVNECSDANSITGSGNLPGGICTPIVIATFTAYALGLGPGAYPLFFLGMYSGSFILIMVLSALIAAILTGICCAIFPFRKGLVIALVLYVASLIPLMLLGIVMVDTG